MKKLTTVATLLMGLMAGAQAQADTRIGVTVYKYDDNFMAVVRKAIEKEAAANPGVELLMNDSQNDQSKQ
ncbi:methyl-galactoside ABC transporter substrate-binding protein, partial [Aeromonas rivipollensis]